MGIINRTKDASEQKESIIGIAANPVNGQDIVIGIMERAVNVTDCKVSMLGLSGAPTVVLKALRFIAGTGGSSFALGTTFAISAYGTSGYVSYSLLASGSSQLSLQKGDLLVATQGGGTGAASTSTIVEVVVQTLQDIKTWY